MTPPRPKPTQEELAAFLAREFPQMPVTIVSVGAGRALVRHPVGDAQLRPGGTVAGPVLMAAADVAVYVALLGEIGLVPLAVTSELSIHFLRKPRADRAILAACTLLKVGRTQAVGEVLLRSEGLDEPVAHAMATYVMPPEASGTAPLGVNAARAAAP